MGTKLNNFISLMRKVFFLAIPYGRRRLLFVFLVILAQGLIQVVGVTSIFPFLAVASDPTAFRNSGIGEKLLGYLPQISDHQLLILVGLFALGMLF